MPFLRDVVVAVHHFKLNKNEEDSYLPCSGSNLIIVSMILHFLRKNHSFYLITSTINTESVMLFGTEKKTLRLIKYSRSLGLHESNKEEAT